MGVTENKLNSFEGWSCISAGKAAAAFDLVSSRGGRNLTLMTEAEIEVNLQSEEYSPADKKLMADSKVLSPMKAVA